MADGCRIGGHSNSNSNTSSNSYSYSYTNINANSHSNGIHDAHVEPSEHSMIVAGQELRRLVENGLVTTTSGKVSVEPVSVGLHLDNQFAEYAENIVEPFTPPRQVNVKSQTVNHEGYVIAPRGKVLACSRERVRMPRNVMGFIQTKGSLARGFLMAHLCDGQVDPGYDGQITLELVNLSDYYYRLVPGMPIVQLYVIRLSEQVEPYSGRYQGAGAPTPMRQQNDDAGARSTGATPGKGHK